MQHHKRWMNSTVLLQNSHIMSSHYANSNSCLCYCVSNLILCSSAFHSSHTLMLALNFQHINCCCALQLVPFHYRTKRSVSTHTYNVANFVIALRVLEQVHSQQCAHVLCVWHTVCIATIYHHTELIGICLYIYLRLLVQQIASMSYVFIEFTNENGASCAPSI